MKWFFYNFSQSHLLQKPLAIHVIHPHAAQMLFVKKEMVLDHVYACLNILVILILVVDQNVSQILIVIDRKHASTTNAKIHVLELVAWTLNVELLIILHLAIAPLDSQAMHWLNASYKNQVNWLKHNSHKWYRYIFY